MRFFFDANLLKPAISGLALAALGAVPATAAEVVLDAKNGSMQVAGDLLEFDGTSYVVATPTLGELRLSADMMDCSGPGCPDYVFEPGAEVTLTSVATNMQMTGRILDFADGRYSVQTDLAVLSARADDVMCEGPGCPTLEILVRGGQVADPEPPAPVRRAADLVMAGSDSVGEDLMPLVMEEFATVIGAQFIEAVEFDEGIAQYIFRRNGGSGDMFVLEIESSDTGPGMERLIEGSADIAMSSRDLTPEQIAAMAARGRGDLRDLSQQYVVATDSVLVTVNTANPIDSLSRQQLIGMYTDQITNWSQVGGPGLPIMPAQRDNGSARDKFDPFLFGGPSELSPRTTEVDRGRDMRNFVEENIGAIGYSISDNIGDTKAVDLILDCGVVTEATPFKTKAEEYLLNRRITLYIANRDVKPEVQQLVNFMISPAADPYVDESGYFSLGIVEDDRALSRLNNAALIGQPASVGRAIQNQINTDLRGANRLSLTFRFPTDVFALDSKARRDLDRLVNYMARPENAGREFIFVGFADTVGPFNYNTQLSRDRAGQVLQEVRRHPDAGNLRGVRLSTVGLSEAAPVSCNDNATGRSLNRRVEVWVR